MLRLAMVALTTFGFTGCSYLAGCGFARWPVKDAIDRDAGQINHAPQNTTIAALTALPAPKHPFERYDIRYAPIETTTYRITATLGRVSFSDEDGDYHLILTDEAGRTMIAEAPDPVCAAGSALAPQMAETRGRIEARFRSVPINPHIPVVVTGVGFFDLIHDVEGQAPNAIELHPIVDIEW